MGIDFIERRSRRSSGGGGGGGGGDIRLSNNGVMASSSSDRIINGDHRHQQQQHQFLTHHHHHHQQHNPNHISHINNNGYQNHNNATTKVSMRECSPKENGYYNQSGATAAVSARARVTSPSPPSSTVNHTRSFLSYTSSPTFNGVNSRNNNHHQPNHHHNNNNNASTSSSSTTTPAAISSSAGSSISTSAAATNNNSTTTNTSNTTPAKPSRTLSVRNFSNFVKRLPSLSLSPSVRIASSLGFSSTNSHNNNTSSNGNNNNTSSSSSSGPQSLTCGGSTATLKRPTTVSFQKKKARPFSYAEPGSLSNGHCSSNGINQQNHLHHPQHHNNIHNGTPTGSNTYASTNGESSHLNPSPISNLIPKGRLENVGNDGPTYNGHNVADLEARLVRLRVQQRERRKSLDFAISCVEPDPTCFSVEEQPAGQDVLGIYIKSVVKNGSADADGRLAAGDQLLSVDGQSLIGISQEEAAKYLVRTGPVVTLEVAKQAALYHGLATMLNQPSPELSRGKGDGADLSFEEEDEYSGDDMDFLGVGGVSGINGSGYNMYHYNGDMRSSCSSSTLVASDSMHLLSPPRPPEDYLRRPTAFPHHLQYQMQNFHPRHHDSEMSQYDQACSSSSVVTTNPILKKTNNMKLVRQLSFPQEEDEDDQQDQDVSVSEGADNLVESSTSTTAMITSAGDATIAETSGTSDGHVLSTADSSSSSPNESTPNESTSSSCQPNDETIENDEKNASTSSSKMLSRQNGTSSTSVDDDAEAFPGDSVTREENDTPTNNNDDDDNEEDEMTRKKAALVDEINRYCVMRRKATSFPQCSLLTGIALSPTTSTASCTNLIRMINGTAPKYRRESVPSKNGESSRIGGSSHYKDKRSTMRATMSASVLLTSSISLNDVSLSSSPSAKNCETSLANSALRDSNYWSSNCSTRDDSSTLCSPSSTLSSNNPALMRASQSDSSLARWTESFEALSRKGLSESALGVPRVVGSSRLLKFLISTYNDSSNGGAAAGGSSQENGDIGGGDGCYTGTNGYYSARKSSSNNFTFLPTRSKSSDAILTCGFNAPRRMSERDLPSKILREQNHDMAVDHPIPGNQFGHGSGVHPLMMQPRIHSSKSVPSLNSDVPNNMGGSGMQPGVNSSGVSPMIRSPAHHPNVNNNVGASHGHHMMHGQNHIIHDSPNGPRYPQGYPNMSMTMQHGSKASMMSGGGHINNVDPQSAAMRSRSIQSLADPPHKPDIGNKQPSTPALHMQQSEDTERFYQNVGFYPPPPVPPANSATMPVRTYIPYSNSTGNISSSVAFRSPGGGGNPMNPHYPGYPGVRAPPPNLNASVPSNLNWQQQQQRVNHTGHLPPQQQLQQNHGVSRDLLRQEAKMLEMQDELRRREERAALMMSKQQMNNPQQQRYNQQYPPQQRPLSGAGPPAPTPKPYRVGESSEMAPGRPPLPDEFKPQFSASMTEIPKGAFSYNNGGVNKSALGSNPWDSEAKEIEAKRRKEAAKYWREQQINELETFPNRSRVQDEQLRALKLEKEFQRRAEEMQRSNDEGAEDEEEEEEDDRKAMVRRLQEDLERTRISNGNSKLDPMEEERARKIEEMRRKKLELEAAQAAEERLVREAAKRREEELRRQHQMMQQQNQSLKHHQSQQLHQQQQLHHHQQHQQQQPPQPPQSLSYQSPYRASYNSKMGSPGSITSENHLNPSSSSAPPLPKSPPPSNTTTFKSAMQQSASSPQKSPVTPPQSSPKPKSDKKTVSFNETVATNEPPASPEEDDDQSEKVREDPNKFLTEASAMLASPRSPDNVTIGSGSTPGVIGAQEVYRDPRMRRLAEQQQKQQAANTPKPEKLTFKEKMRMFAMESGDIESPKDKVKVSKAQREIEGPNQGPPQNVNLVGK